MKLMKRKIEPDGTTEVSASRRRMLAGAVAATAAFSMSPRVGAQSGNGSLRLYSWPDYTGGSALDDFTASSGISASADIYSSGEEMLRNISSADNRFDLVIASYDYVERMIGDGLLLPIDHSKIPNAGNLLSVFRDARFDPGRRYSMPYLWGTQGICFRKSAVSAIPESWGALLDSDEHSGRIALPGRDTIGLALKYLGHWYNSVDPAQLKAAGELLIRQKPHVRSFFGDSALELLAKGDIDLTVGWSSEVVQLMAEDDDIGYRVPVEGGLLWQDCLCIPRSAANPDGAHKLINFALGAEAGATIAQDYWYSTPNRAALALLPEGYWDDPVIFPGMDIAVRCEAALNLGRKGTQLRDRTWQAVVDA